MSRFRTAKSYGQRVAYLAGFGGFYRVSWTVDFHYASSRLRHPRHFSRDTDEAGARRFAKKWGCQFPETGENKR